MTEHFQCQDMQELCTAIQNSGHSATYSITIMILRNIAGGKYNIIPFGLLE